jgi:predicted transcriptional regulator
MKIDDIAKLMDISRSSVKRYLKSGQDKLSKLIKR